MEVVDVEHTLSSDHRLLQTEVGKPSIPRSREVSGGACETDVDKLDRRENVQGSTLLRLGLLCR